MMKRKFRFSCLLLLLIFCFSFVCLSASAVDGEGEDIIISDEGDIVYEEETDPPYYEEETDPPYYEEETDPPYVDEDVQTDPPYDDSDNNDYSNDDNNDSDYSTDDYSNDDYSDYTVEDYYEDNADEFQNYNENTAETAASTETLYEVNHKIDTENFNSDEWAQLNNLVEGGDDIDFSKMQSDTSYGDDKGMIFIIGIILLVLGIAGTLFVIGWYVLINSKTKKNPAAAGAAPMAVNNAPIAKQPKNKAEKRAAKKRSKFDTGEITLPQKAAKGKYKPKH